MNPSKRVLEQLWSRQQIGGSDVDYDSWEQKRASLQQMAEISRNCVFAVDVYRGVYDYASSGFGSLLGIDRKILQNICGHGDAIEDRIHPEDRDEILDLQIRHGRFIYGLAPEKRNDYRTIYQWRMRNSGNKYVNVVSSQQVLEKDRNGKAWIIMGMMELSPDQSPAENVKCTVLNLKTGRIHNPYNYYENSVLTNRELEVLLLARKGYLSKEIADRLGISIHTIHNHRKNILFKLGADNMLEAVSHAMQAGLIY